MDRNPRWGCVRTVDSSPNCAVQTVDKLFTASESVNVNIGKKGTKTSASPSR